MSARDSVARISVLRSPAVGFSNTDETMVLEMKKERLITAALNGITRRLLE